MTDIIKNIFRFRIKKQKKEELLIKKNVSFFIFTEIFNCGKIGRVAIDSFYRHHPDTPLHIYGTYDDFKWINNHKNTFILHDYTDKKNIILGFRRGHLGTALLWAHLIKKRPEKYVIHLDSDVFFRKRAIDNLINSCLKGNDLVGARRNYRYNSNQIKEVKIYQDLCHTCFFAFNRELIGKYSDKELVRMCQGTYNPYHHPIIDFFDPVMFDILYHGGKIDFLKQKDFGGFDYYGRKINSKYGILNKDIDIGDKFIHFASVGSGMNFYNNKANIRDVPDIYINYAVGKYLMFCKLFYDEKLSYSHAVQAYKAEYEKLKKMLNADI